MGFLDKAKDKATQLGQQAKEKIDDVKEGKKVDELLDDLGRITYRQRTERGTDEDAALITELVGKLQALEADGADVLKVKAAGTAPETNDVPANDAPAAPAAPPPPPPPTAPTASDMPGQPPTAPI